MSQTISIYRNWGEPDEIHMRISIIDQDYSRMLELVKTEHLPSTEAYDRMRSEKSAKDS